MKFYPQKMTTPPVVEIAPGVRGGFAFREPETGVPFAYNTWHELILNVRNHRLGMSLDLADGWHLRFEDEFCRQNPHLQCEDDQKPWTLDTPLAIAGRAAWAELHAFCESYAENPTDDDRSRALYWMSAWRERIPRFGGCSCREDWGRLVASFPPDYTSRETLVRWATCGHDWVNRRIGKPLFRPDWFELSPCKDV